MNPFIDLFSNIKCYRRATWNFTNKLQTLITTKQHTKNFLGVQEPALVVFSVCFFEFLTPFTLWGRNFVITNLFSTIVSVSDVPRGEVQVLFGHQNQWSPPLKSGLPWALKCSVTGRSTLPTWVLVSPFKSKRLHLPTPAFNIVQVALIILESSLFSWHVKVSNEKT
jgi:hypothetical protein